MNLARAIKIAATVFEDKKDKGGSHYILHCLYVMEKVKHLGEDAMTVAVLHDVIEDTEITYEDLIDEGFDRVKIVDRIALLTHCDGEEYMSYIKRLSYDDICREIKKADLRHNSDITRIKGLRKKDFDRLEKYHIAYEYLKG